VAPRDTLVDQIGVDFIRDGVLDTTVLQGGKRYRPDARFKIASLQTVDRRAGQAGAYPDFDFVVFDECHMWTSATYKWMEARPETIFLGLTATPGMPRMGEYYEERIVGATVKHLLGLGYLAPIRAFAPKATAIDLSSVRIVAGDYDEEGLIREVDNAKITGDIVKHYQEFGQGRSALAICINRRHAAHLEAEFKRTGLPTAYIDCDTPGDERAAIFERFKAGAIQIICSISTLEVGVDLPNAACLIDARPTRSRVRYVQTNGRIQRTCEGKVDAIVFDHARNIKQHGLIEDIIWPPLNVGGRAKGGCKAFEESAAGGSVNLCPVCDAANAPDAVRCFHCKHVFPLQGVIVEQGDLAELKPSTASTGDPELDERIRIYGEFKFEAAVCGYNPKWARHQFKAWFGAPPTDPRILAAAPIPPRAATAQWISDQRRAFREQMLAKEAAESAAAAKPAKVVEVII
jgi:superfamily II DNA or RNA helicase